ncbi:acid protease [Cyberlindnera jadinii NRRL Y-1542]|uniref:Acid protease n=1 Tax=Cyberlindnera jadinii (strain ATCC 18201 / CBS 1600 / BCRC 20928 / JCM 3617 / NBRC 0987 / NRRL Y-1542) TaxID=983966 RepID=A0A1E4S8P5_CYBJN|nr:acid protease [Cyberlindnera jadinii NRRL Y-1542]ODV75843.1 acid protease [Cyberlindnera jadinii NRRL Y-1542]
MKLSNLIIGSTFAALAFSNAVPMKFDVLRGNDFHSAKKIPKLSKRGDGTVYADMFYEGGIFFGSRMVVNGTEIFALLDTGSSDFWVNAPNNPYCSSNRGGEIVFPAASETISVSSEAATIDCEEYGILDVDVEVLEGDHPTFVIGYGDTTVAAGVYLDGVVTIGNATLSDFTFGVANVSNATPICGLSFEQTESTHYIYQNLPSALKQTGLIKRTAFSMWLDGENAEGYILFGGIDHSKYEGELVTLPLVAGQNMSQPSTFNVNLNSIDINDGEVEIEVLSNTTSVLFDSGTSEVYLPPNAVENIAEALKATYSDSWGQYLVRCPEQSTNITFGFNFDGLKVDIPLETFLVATDSSHKECALNIFAGTKGVNYILGDVFLQESCTSEQQQ